MIKALSTICTAIVLSFILALPYRASADKFFNDDDEFFLKYLQQDKFSLDTSAPAIVLYEHHTISLGGDEVRKVIKIIKKSGLSYADVLILMRGEGEYVTGVRGCTYNLEDGKIVKQEISKDNTGLEGTRIIKEKKISLPSVKEGSIIDYHYEIKGRNNFYYLAKWNVQEDIPKLYDRLDIIVPELYTVDAVDQVVPVFIKASEDKKGITDNMLPYSYTYEENTGQNYWVRRNVAAFAEEPYLSDESNYKETMYVYLRSLERYGPFASYLKSLGLSTLDTWKDINKVMVHVFLDKPVLVSEQPVKDKAREIAGDDTNSLRIAKKIFRFVNNTIASDGSDNMFNNKNLAKVLSDRSGSNAEVNLLLMAMLRARGLDCSPVIVATKDQGTPRTDYPDLFKYNYVVCELRLNGEKYYLDASEKYSPFGALPLDCLNGLAWVVDRTDSGRVLLTPAMAKDKGFFAVTTVDNSTTNYTLNYKYYYGDQEAKHYRQEWNKDSTEIKKYILSAFKNSAITVQLKQYSVQNLKDADGVLSLDFSIGFEWPADASAIYYAPYFIQFFDKNPFQKATRKYPIDLPYTENLTYTCKLQLPQGYTIEEIPKSAIVTIDDNVQYKNRVIYDKETGTLNIDSRLQMQRQHYKVQEYEVLKEFLDKIIEQQQTNIVIKKTT